MHEVKQIDLKDTLDGEFLKSLSMNPADYRIMRHREIGHPHTAKQSFKKSYFQKKQEMSPCLLTPGFEMTQQMNKFDLKNLNKLNDTKTVSFQRGEV